MKKRLGAANDGLLTGDLNINSATDVVVMTTEVFRGMLNKEEATSTDDVFAVVHDEFHFMNSYPRGTVIEEIVIRTPRDVLPVALSATMPNAIDVRRWFDAVHGCTVLVQSNVRPVTLIFFFCDQTVLSFVRPALWKERSRGYCECRAEQQGKTAQKSGSESKACSIAAFLPISGSSAGTAENATSHFLRL